MAENILIIAAHSDDQIIGVGGTAAKYAKEGYNIKTIIAFGGEETHPHFQEDIIISTRMKESIRADKVIGGKGVKFLNFVEKRFKEKEFEQYKEKVVAIIKKLKPVKVFTHTSEDPHPGHRKVNRAVMEIVKDMKKVEVYSFDIWNMFKFKKAYPKLVIDITTTFDQKIKALKCFKSQFNVYAFINFLPLSIMYVKNHVNGMKYNVKYAEVFYRLK